MDVVLNPWPWYVAGPLIALTMFLMLYFGKSFGVSSTFRHACSACGLGKKASFFEYDWKSQKWNLLFVLGGLIGGFIASEFLTKPDAIVAISSQTVNDLAALGIEHNDGLLPNQLFAFENLSLKNLLLLVLGGFLVGFGVRYAGGCTSGHAISGLSNLQLPSLVAVIGFFIGGLLMTHVLFPLIF